MNVLLIAPVQEGHLGGITQSSRRLADAIAKYTNVNTALLSSISKAPIPCEHAEYFGLQTGMWIKDRLRRSLSEAWMTPDLVHFHSTYIPAQAQIARYFHKIRIPYLISPRGGIMQYAQNKKYWKKKLGNVLFFNAMVKNAAALHCLTLRESEQAETWHHRRFVIPNPVAIPDEKICSTRDVTKPIQFTYVGRIDIAIKGLDRLLEGVSYCLKKSPDADIHVNLVGPDSGNQQQKLEQFARTNNLNKYVSFRGPCKPDALHSVFNATDVSLLCSRSEGQPNALIEAMAHGVPCLITPETNMAEVVREANAGWVCDGSPQSISEAIKAIVANPEAITSAGKCAAKLARNTFAEPIVAQAMVELYQSLLKD